MRSRSTSALIAFRRTLLVSAFWGVATAAAAEPEPVDDDLAARAPEPAVVAPSIAAQTLPAEPEQEKYYLRAILEHQGLFVLGLLWYVTTTDIRHDWDLGYRWNAFEDKLTGAAIKIDTNRFGTNFIGHPVGGTGYYIAARSNGLGIPEAFGFSVAGSLLWEYFGEVTEIISANDMVVTPFGGMAIGEATTQLGAFFDRSSPTLGHRVLSTLFAPLRAVNRAMDSEPLEPSPSLDARGLPSEEWHRFRLFALSAATHQGRTRELPGTTFASYGVEASSRLARLPDYDGAGRHSLGFGDARVSHLDLRISGSEHGVGDLAFECGFLLGGYYLRDATLDRAGRVSGGGLVVGIGTSFLYSLHDYDTDRVRPTDRIARVTPLGVLFEHRGALGPVNSSARIDVGPDFGGVQPYALPNGIAPEDPGDFERVTRIHGYYHSLGAHFASSLELGVGPVTLAGSLRAERHQAMNALGRAPSDPSTIVDTRTEADARLMLRLPNTPATLLGYAARRLRAGRAGPSRDDRTETALGGGLGVEL
jgi:hypothetical protein